MRPVLDVWVAGLPATKGSVNVGRHGQVLPAHRGMAAWSERIRRCGEVALRRAGPAVPPGGAAFVVVSYFLSRPNDVDPLTVPPIRARSGDLDKLERCVWDALTAARVWADDVQVIMAHPAKYYAGPDIGSGAHVRVLEFEGNEYEHWRATAVREARLSVGRWFGQGDVYPTGG